MTETRAWASRRAAGFGRVPGILGFLAALLLAWPVPAGAAPGTAGADLDGSISVNLPLGKLVAELGDLLVTTYPAGAVVRINAKILGTTPMEPLAIEPGWHLVQAEKSELFASARVHVDPGEITRVALTLGDGRGTLDVFSTPDSAEVILDGGERGRTPIRLTGVPAGDHDLRLHREGFVEYHADLEIRTGEESRLDAYLPVPARLDIRSEPPGASVYIGGRSVGRTPTVADDVKPGRVVVTLKMENYEEWSDARDLGEGESDTLSVPLTSQKRPVLLLSDPPGAEIRMDDRVLGITPLRWAVPLGERQFVFRLEGYEDYRLKTYVSLDMGPSLEVVLIPLCGFLTLRGEPPGTTVTLLGGDHAAWPSPLLDQPVPAGSHAFRIRAPGYETVVVESSVLPGEELVLEPSWAPKSRTGGLHRILVPGWSQRYQEKRNRSILFPAAQLVSLAGLLITTNAYNEAVDDYEIAWTRYLNEVAPDAVASAWEEAGRRHDRMEDRRGTRRVFLAASVGIYICNLLDATLFAPAHPDTRSAGLLHLEADAATETLVLGIRIPF